MSRRLILQALFIIILLSVAVIVLALKLGTKKNKKAILKPRQIGKSKDIWIVYYNSLAKFGPTKKYINNIRKKIEAIEISDNWTVSRKTAKFSIISLSISIILFIILLVFDIDMYYLLIVTSMIIIIHSHIIRSMTLRLENKLLIQFGKFLGDVRHHYHEHGMIDESIYDSIEDCKYEMAQHASVLYQVLTSDDPENEVDKYNDKAPNKYFKIFLSNCFTVQKFGDRTIDKQSVFLSNINYLDQEISYELLRRQKLDYLFSSLSTIAIAPIFALKPLENWGKAYVTDMAVYYDGAYGFIAQIVLFITIIICYQLLSSLRRDYEYSQESLRFYESIVKITFIKQFINSMINKQYSKAQKYREVIRLSGVKQSINVFYLRRLFFMMIGLLLSLAIFINIHGVRRYNILYKSENIMRNDTKVELEAEKQILSLDRDIILTYKYKNVDFDIVFKHIIQSGKIRDKKLAGIAARRILIKINEYNKEYFKWWELVISILISLIAFNIPYWLLLFRKKVIRMNMEDEVMQFHTIILMLITIERTSVEDILRWMEQFAIIFKDSIGKCINDFDTGDIEALEQLKLDEPFVPFVRIGENLQAACERISILSAFDQLIVERNFYQEKRKQDNEILINKKGVIAKLIAFMPLAATICFYLLVPFILVSINQLMTYSNQINGMF